jgi:hypothetical protein
MSSTKPMMVFDGNFLAEGDRVVQGIFYFLFFLSADPGSQAFKDNLNHDNRAISYKNQFN